MERVMLNGADIEYEVRGSGEPLLLIHGSIIADAFFPLLNQPGIANAYHVISYHRRGFAGSARAQDPFTIRQQATDAHALLRHLGIPRAHVAGHSYGGAIALQLAIDTPEDVHSLRCLQPVLSVVGSDTESYFREAHELVQQWMPQAEELVISQATHALQYMNPSAVADGLVRFLVKHRL